MIRLLFLLLLFLVLPNSLCAQEAASDEAAINQVILNYVNSFYLADTARVHASVHPELAKRGYSKRNNQYQEYKMSFRQMVNLSGKWNKTNPIPADAPKEITIFEIKDKIATAKVRALWGTDYFHLVKENGQWKILHVLWQS